MTCKYCNKSYVAPKSERRWSHNSSLDKTSSDSAEIESLVDMQAAMKCLHAELGTHRPDIVLKDNNLRSKIMLSEPECRAILTQLRKDANFLCDNGFMDYSLLIGVHHAHFDVNSDAAEPICKDRTSFGRTARKYQVSFSSIWRLLSYRYYSIVIFKTVFVSFPSLFLPCRPLELWVRNPIISGLSIFSSDGHGKSGRNVQ